MRLSRLQHNILTMFRRGQTLHDHFNSYEDSMGLECHAPHAAAYMESSMGVKASRRSVARAMDTLESHGLLVSRTVWEPRHDGFGGSWVRYFSPPSHAPWLAAVAAINNAKNAADSAFGFGFAFGGGRIPVKQADADACKRVLSEGFDAIPPQCRALRAEYEDAAASVLSHLRRCKVED